MLSINYANLPNLGANLHTLGPDLGIIPLNSGIISEKWYSRYIFNNPRCFLNSAKKTSGIVNPAIFFPGLDYLAGITIFCGYGNRSPSKEIKDGE